MAEYIEREALLAEADCDSNFMFVIPAKKVRSIPAADVAPVVHGHWYWDADGETGNNIRRCSVCHEGSGWATNYCHNCGAKMDAEAQEKPPYFGRRR